MIDADKISHEILDENAGEIVEIFGDGFVNSGVVNRKKLGELVFSDKSALERLERLLHPKIKAQIYEKAEILERKNTPYFVDIPLFFEKNNYEFTRVLLIYAPREILLKRVVARDNLDKNAVNSRLDAQMDIEKKRILASDIIDNSGDLKSLNEQISRFIDSLKEKYAHI